MLYVTDFITEAEWLAINAPTAPGYVERWNDFEDFLKIKCHAYKADFLKESKDWANSDDPTVTDDEKLAAQLIIAILE